MLDHEETDDQGRRGHHQQQTTPMAVNKNDRHHGPDDKEGPRCDRQLEHATRVVGLAITRELLRQHARLWSAFKHPWTAFEHVHSKHVYSPPLPGPRHVGPRSADGIDEPITSRSDKCRDEIHFRLLVERPLPEPGY